MPSPITKNDANKFHKLERIVEKWLADAEQVGKALAEIKAGGWWLTPKGPPTFELYVKQRFGKSARTARRLMAAVREPTDVEINKVLPVVTVGEVEIILTESQRAALQRVPEDQRSEVAEKAYNATPQPDGKTPDLPRDAINAAARAVRASRAKEGATGAQRASADRGQFLRFLHQLEALRRDLTMHKDRYAFRHLHADETIAHLLNATQQIKADMPYCECLYCRPDSRERATCEACEGEGWIQKSLFDRATSELQESAVLL